MTLFAGRPPVPFHVTSWHEIEPVRSMGLSGWSAARTTEVGGVRIRLVEYSPGYEADHWCERGHVLFCIEGHLRTELADGQIYALSAGQSYQVGDGVIAHRSSTAGGARLFVVD